jgi:hypothetical protein
MERLATLDLINSVIKLNRILTTENDGDLLPEDIEYKQSLSKTVNVFRQQIPDSHLINFDDSCKMIYEEFLEELKQRERN